MAKRKTKPKKKAPASAVDTKQIVKFVEKEPGASFRKIARNVDIPRDRLRSELEQLVKDGKLFRQRFRNRDCHFPNKATFTKNWEKIMLLQQMSGMRDLYEYLQKHPGVNQKDVLAWAGRKRWKRSTTQWRLKQLVKHNLLSEKAKGREVYYRPVGKVPAVIK